MSKIGISIKLDVKKLDKARFFAAQSGALYVDLTMFLDPDSEGQYGDHGFLTQSTSKEEREQQVQMPILGNGKIFYGLQELKGVGHTSGTQSAPQQKAQGSFQPQQQIAGQPAPQYQSAPKVNPQEPSIDFNDDVPF